MKRLHYQSSAPPRPNCWAMALLKQLRSWRVCLLLPLTLWLMCYGLIHLRTQPTSAGFVAAGSFRLFLNSEVLRIDRFEAPILRSTEAESKLQTPGSPLPTRSNGWTNQIHSGSLITTARGGYWQGSRVQPFSSVGIRTWPWWSITIVQTVIWLFQLLNEAESCAARQTAVKQ